MQYECPYIEIICRHIKRMQEIFVYWYGNISKTYCKMNLKDILQNTVCYSKSIKTNLWCVCVCLCVMEVYVCREKTGSLEMLACKYCILPVVSQDCCLFTAQIAPVLTTHCSWGLAPVLLSHSPTLVSWAQGASLCGPASFYLRVMLRSQDPGAGCACCCW